MGLVSTLPTPIIPAGSDQQDDQHHDTDADRATDQEHN